MKLVRAASLFARIVFWIVMAIALFATGIILVLYSQWGQDTLRQKAVAALNSRPGVNVRLDNFRLKFPASLNLAGLTLATQGDTLIEAGTLAAEIKLLPLIKGEIAITNATLEKGFYQLGAPDSAMWIRISADTLAISPAKVTLSPLDIDIMDAFIGGGLVDMTLREDTTSTPADTTAQQPLSIKLHKLRVNDLTYKMSMLPTIDSLGTTIVKGTLTDGTIDLLKQTVKLKSFTGEALNAAYIAPDSATVASYPTVTATDPTETPSAPWTIEIDTIRFANSKALYTTRGVTPLPGLDFAYISADSLDLEITDFFNQATTLNMPLKMSATERCGIRLDASGVFSLDSTSMRFRNFDIATANTKIKANGMMGMGDILTDPTLPLRINAEGQCAFADLMKMFPEFTPYLSLLPRGGKADLNVALDGTSSKLDINAFNLGINNCIRLKTKGYLTDVFMPERIGGAMAFSGNIIDVKSIVNAFVDPSMGLSIPPMTLDGKAKIANGVTAADLRAFTLGGTLAFDGTYNSNNEGYSLSLDTRDFPVNAFMPSLNVGKATASLDATGNSFDLMSKHTSLKAKADVKSVVFSDYDYRDISMTATIDDGKADIMAISDNPDAHIKLVAEGNIAGESYVWNADIDCENVDLQAINMAETPLSFSTVAKADVTYTPKTNDIEALLSVSDLYYKGDEAMEFTLSDINAHLTATDSTTNISLHNHDLIANAAIPLGILKISECSDSLTKVIDRQLAQKIINVDSIQKAMPKFSVEINGGDDNFINDILRAQKMSIGHIAVEASNDSAIFVNSGIIQLNTGSMLIDTVSLNINQLGEKMRIIGAINNKKGNLDNFAHVRFDGMLNLDKISMRVTQQNASDEIGFDFGAIAALADSTVTARFFPLNPVIGYKKWTVNFDNYVKYDMHTKHIDANLKMKGDDSSLQLYTDHNHTDGLHQIADSINNITLKISDVHLADWIAFNPFAPPISGNLSADVNLAWDGGSTINGEGDVSLTDFLYDNRNVASLLLDFDIVTNTSGTIRANADLMVDGEKTMSIAGNLNDADADSPFRLDFSVIRFPLSTVNPFLPEDVAQLSGALNGKMLISGDAEHPVLNGDIDFSDAYIKIAMTNTAYKLSDVKIPVEDNIVTLSDFDIKGANENPLYINGKVDISSMTNVRYDLNMKARNMMLVNTTKASRRAVVFGKAFVNVDVAAKGNMNFINLDADLTVLSGTNVTYILTEEANEISQLTNDDMVKFVNLNDSSAVAIADSLTSQGMLMALDAKLTIQNGTTITVDLPTGTRDKVEIQADGTLTYTQSPVATQGRMIGRLMINSGMARYTLPMIGSEKKFTFEQGSYIAFNGDILNPVLNIHASDPMKVNVTQEGQNSRLVNFDILLGITGTLDKMDVAFDLTTDDDLSVANELQSMTAQQRANQAMNMLLYGMYTGPNTQTAAGNLSSDILYSFLEGQLNNWAAQNIKGVDLSFGIDQYNQTTNGVTSSAMNYSYQVSKSLFDDRFKVVVGGSYSTDNNADENLAENLINDISFEYFLNSQQTMVLKIFRHVGYESILEGEVTQTGVGFVYRRKLNRLSKMLPKFIRPKYKD